MRTINLTGAGASGTPTHPIITPSRDSQSINTAQPVNNRRNRTFLICFSGSDLFDPGNDAARVLNKPFTPTKKGTRRCPFSKFQVRGSEPSHMKG